jgi:hypothetical protein
MSFDSEINKQEKIQLDEIDSVAARAAYSLSEFRGEQVSELAESRRRDSAAQSQQVQSTIRQQEEQHAMYMRHQEQNHLLWTAVFSIVLSNLSGNQSISRSDNSALAGNLSQVLAKLAETVPPKS